MAYKENEGTKQISSRKKLKEAAELVKSRFNVSDSFTRGYFTKFQDYYKLYRSSLSGGLPWRSKLFIPKIFEIIETIAPRVAMSQKKFKTLPVEGTDVANAEAFTDLLDFQFEQTNMEEVIEELTKESLIYGTSIAKVTWRDDKPTAEVVDIFDFYPDPKARNQDEMKYAIHRLERDYLDLESNPNYDKAALKKLKAGDGNATSNNQERQQREGVLGITSEDGTRKRYEVLEYWGEFQDKNYIIVLADGVVLRCEESPYANPIPFVVIRDTVVPHEFYGIGEIEPIESLQNELNDVRNQRMDNIKLNLNNMWKVVAGGVQFEDELVSRPGGIIHLTRPDGLMPNDRQPIPSEAFTEESIIKSDMERTDGANSPLSGSLTSPSQGTNAGAGNKTATAWQGAINQADKRFSAKVNQLKRGLIRIGRKYLELDQQFMDKETQIRILGKDGEPMMVNLLPEDIKSSFDLTVEIEYLDEYQRLTQDVQLLQTMANVPGFNVAQLAIDIIEKSGKKNVEKYLSPPEPPKPEQPKVNYQLKGDMAPDAVAQLIDKKDNIKTNPKVVATDMRAGRLSNAEKAAKIEESLTTQ